MNLVQVLIIVAACAVFVLARLALRRIPSDRCRPALRRVLLVLLGVMAAWWGVANYLSAEYSANWRWPHGTSLADARARGYLLAAPTLTDSSVRYEGSWRIREVWTERIERTVYPMPPLRLRLPTGQIRVLVRMEGRFPTLPSTLNLCLLSPGPAIQLHQDRLGVWVGPVPDQADGEGLRRPTLDSIRIAVRPEVCRESL